MKRKPGPETFTDNSESCTKEEAVAKLIGWMRGTLRRNLIELDEFGAILADQLPYLHTIEGTVLDMAYDQLSAALLALRFAENDGADETAIALRKQAVSDTERQYAAAAKYTAALDMEIAKKSSSSLEFDSAAKELTGELHITIDSLEKWASEKYGISVSVLPNIPFVVSPSTDEQDRPSYQDLMDKGWLSPVLAGHMQRTLALAMIALANTRDVFRTGDSTVNVSGIAMELEAIAKHESSGELKGQKVRSITTRLEDALLNLKNNLPGNLRNL